MKVHRTIRIQPLGRQAARMKHEAGNWYAYPVFNMEAAEASVPRSIRGVGINRSVGQLATSDGMIDRKRNQEVLETHLRRYRRMTLRRDTGSRKKRVPPPGRYLRAKLPHRKTRKKLLHARTDWCHRVSRELTNRYDVAYSEELNVKGVTAGAKGTAEAPGKHVAQKAGSDKSIPDTAWSIERCLGCKMSVEKVPAAYTSQRCNACGRTEKANRNTQSEFKCRKCGRRDNAEMNAALNILAFRNGAAGRGGGNVGRPLKRQVDAGSPANLCI